MEEGNLTDYLNKLTEKYQEIRESGKDLFRVAFSTSLKEYLVSLPDKKRYKVLYPDDLNQEDKECLEELLRFEKKEIDNLKIFKYKEFVPIHLFSLYILEEITQKGYSLLRNK